MVRSLVLGHTAAMKQSDRSDELPVGRRLTASALFPRLAFDGRCWRSRSGTEPSPQGDAPHASPWAT